MIVYKYDEEGYYSGAHDCQPCTKTGGWLYPPRYLKIAPLDEEEWGISKVKDNKWVLVPDNRNREIWNKQTGEYKRCEAMDIPADYTTVKPPYEFYHVFDGSWKIDAAKKSAYDAQKEVMEDEAMIAAEMRKMAIAALGDKLKVVNK